MDKDSRLKERINKLIAFYNDNGKEVFLLPANSKYRPIKPKAELNIAGVVVAVIRKLK